MSASEKKKTVEGKNKGMATRDRLIKAATHSIAVEGFEGTSADRIASVAKAAKPLIFHYFDDIEGLKLEVVKSCIRSGQVYVSQALLDAKATPLHEAYVRANFEWSRTHPKESATLIAAIHRSSYHRPTRKILEKMYEMAWQRIGQLVGDLTTARALQTLVISYIVLANMKLAAAPSGSCEEECVKSAKKLINP